MGYTTDFSGAFKLNKKLDAETKCFLTKFAGSRRMARKLGPEYGVEGEFYVAAADDGNFGQNDDPSVIDHNRPPRTQPGLWCQWVPNEAGTAIVWDGGEKFYDYVEWIKYIIKNFLAPRGYILNGDVQWQGEDTGDIGVISIKNNVVKTKKAKFTFEDEA